jgi:predicted permease
MNPRLPAAVRAVLRVAGLLVPPRRAAQWRRQWEAELVHRRSALGSDRGLVRFALGSFGHAQYVGHDEGMTMMRGVFVDLTFTVRALVRRPAFLFLSLATLAVGIGAVTTVVSVTEAVLLRGLPFPGADGLTALYSSNPSAGMDRFSVSYPDFVDWTGRADLFESASFYSLADRDLSGQDEPRRLIVAAVHTGFFETLRSRAALGRLLIGSDHDSQAERTVVLGHGLWARAFGSDPGVIGRTVRLDGVPHTVVGVTAAGQEWPRGASAWIPLQYGTTPPEQVDRRSNHQWQVVARLRADVTPAFASDQVRAMARTWYSANEAGMEQTIEAVVVPLRSAGAPSEAAVGLAVMGTAVLLVLLIACINQSNLLLVHAWGRARELSLRAALGAGRARLGLLLLGESALLALTGAALGIGLARLALAALGTLVPQGAGGDIDARLNAFVVAGTVGIALASSLVAGLAPALKASRFSVAESLSEGGARTGQGRSGARLRRSLVVVEIALSVVLLTGAGLTIRTFQAQLEADTGLDSEGVLVFDVRLPGARYPDQALVTQYLDAAVSRLEATPSIVAASATSSLPLGVSRFNTRRAFLFEGAPEPPGGPDFGALWIEADPRYFPTLGVELRRGRNFTTDDVSGTEPVMLVNETMARLMSPEQEILGRRIRSWRDEDLLREVVGVVPDIQLGTLAGRSEPAVFVPRAQSDSRAMSFIVRSAGDPDAAAPAVRAVMRDLDGDVALDGMRTLEAARRDELAGVRMVTVIFGVFGLLALVLAVGGVYGLVATSVSQRTRELGIRMALGGTSGSVRSMVMWEGAWLAMAGLGSGLILAFAAVKVLSSVLAGLVLVDAWMFLEVAATLTSAVLLASWLPAVHATRISPVEALRSE